MRNPVFAKLDALIRECGPEPSRRRGSTRGRHWRCQQERQESIAAVAAKMREKYLSPKRRAILKGWETRRASQAGE